LLSVNLKGLPVYDTVPVFLEGAEENTDFSFRFSMFQPRFECGISEIQLKSGIYIYIYIYDLLITVLCPIRMVFNIEWRSVLIEITVSVAYVEQYIEIHVKGLGKSLIVCWNIRRWDEN
jgi:hypothetical protein